MQRSLSELANSLASGAVSPATHVSQLVARIHRTEPAVRAWAHVGASQARRSAHAAPKGPLYGLCVGVKDIYDTADMPTAFGSPIYADRRPSEDAALVRLLRERGAVVLGKTHTAGFAYFDPAPTANPHNPAHTPGGSSSGSAAAVAAGMVPFALGSQTQGSVLRPASYCGVAGFKPTFDGLPLEGVLPFASTLDHAGLFTRTAADMAWLWAALTGGDAIAARPPKRVIVPEWPLEGGLEPQMAQAFERAVSALATSGWTVERAGLVGQLSRIMPAVHCVFAYEGARTHRERFKQHGDAIGAKLSEIVRRGLRIPDDEHAAAIGEFQASRAAFAQLCGPDEVWLTPAALDPAPRGLEATGDPAANSPFTALGVPALAIPMGKTAEGLPLGLQIASQRGAELTVLGAGLAIADLLDA